MIPAIPATLLDIFTLLAEHADLIEDVIAAVRSGASKDAIKKALRDVKVATSDAAVLEELGLSPVVAAQARPAGV